MADAEAAEAVGPAFVWTSLEAHPDALDDPPTAAYVKAGGRARVTYANGDVYIGGFSADAAHRKHGRGLYTWSTQPGAHPWVPEAGFPNGRAPTVRYEGAYKDGHRHGAGKLHMPNGDRYHGFFDADAFHGQGTYYYAASGDVYSGAWVRGQKSGEGTLISRADGSQRTGAWVKGELRHGKWVWADGTVWVGRFRDSAPMGRGAFYFRNGTMQEGTYATAATAAVGDGGEASGGLAAVWSGGPFVPADLPVQEVEHAQVQVIA